MARVLDTTESRIRTIICRNPAGHEWITDEPVTTLKVDASTPEVIYFSRDGLERCIHCDSLRFGPVAGSAAGGAPRDRPIARVIG